MKAVSTALAAFSQEDINRIEKEGQYHVQVQGEDVILQIGEVEISSEDIPGWTVASKGRLTVALDITVTPELEAEGNAREFVNRIQKIRKDSGFELTDRVTILVSVSNGLKDSLTRFKDYICAEILADKLEFLPENVAEIDETFKNGAVGVEINDYLLNVKVSKKGKTMATKKKPAPKKASKPAPKKKPVAKKPVAKAAKPAKNLLQNL
jgi:isoleucyl-tRNA synthetase